MLISDILLLRYFVLILHQILCCMQCVLCTMIFVLFNKKKYHWSIRKASRREAKKHVKSLNVPMDERSHCLFRLCNNTKIVLKIIFRKIVGSNICSDSPSILVYSNTTMDWAASSHFSRNIIHDDNNYARHLFFF